MNNQHNNRYSWRRWLFIAFPPLAAVFFALALTMPALASIVVNFTSPVNITTPNPCNGEMVTASGNEHPTVHSTLDGNGGSHVDVHFNFENVTGVGSFGNTYQIPFAAHQLFNVRIGVANTLAETMNVISRGSAPNFLFHENFRITINPDGTVTFFHENSRSECPG